MIATVSRKAHFNAAHKLSRPDWSLSKNKTVFGKCANPHFHGHNYELIVSVTGAINSETGYVVDIKWLKNLIKERVEDYLDHKNLNLEIEEFETLNPTVENISVVIFNKLQSHLPEGLKLKITLFETPLNFVEYSGD